MTSSEGTSQPGTWYEIGTSGRQNLRQKRRQSARIERHSGLWGRGGIHASGFFILRTRSGLVGVMREQKPSVQLPTTKYLASPSTQRAQLSSQGLQELDDGFLLVPFEFFELLGYMSCFAAVP
jgi:hypothetical protein